MAALLFCYAAASAQSLHAETCLKQRLGSAAKVTVADPAEDLYDVKYVLLDIALSNRSTEISGSVTTTALSLSAISNYTFELTDVLMIDSVKLNGLSADFLREGMVVRALFPAGIPVNTLFTAQVFYHGVAITGTAYATSGLNNDTAWSTRVTFTLSEPYASREWWPCKQSLQDKIDSADIHITVDAGLKAGSNGLLQNVVQLPGKKTRYEWKTRYPIAYYLISASVAPYREYSFYTTIPGVKDSVLIQNYIYDDAEFFARYKQGIDSLGLMMRFFSELFGPYPFYNEKYGHCTAPFFGGMEHQTMTTQLDFGTDLTVHELGHQWFGNNVTCATWSDIWLNEGFASYTEYLFKERFRPAREARAHMDEFHRRNLEYETPAGSVYVYDTVSDNRIFDGRLSYSKGAAIVHTLRFVINDDDKFFTLLKKYQQTFADGNATTEMFEQLAETETGLELTTFFDQWIYKDGYPIIDAEWSNVNDKVFLKLKQRGAVPQSVNVFKTPLEVMFLSPEGDTTIRYDFEAAEADYTFMTGKRITGIVIDPSNYVLNAVSGVVRNPGLRLNEVSSGSVVVFPNPAVNNWYAIGLNDDYELRLTDMTGRTLWKSNNTGTRSVEIPAGRYAGGVYFLSLVQAGKITETYKLIKQ